MSSHDLSTLNFSPSPLLGWRDRERERRECPYMKIQINSCYGAKQKDDASFGSE
jgi:hypothetical protein